MQLNEIQARFKETLLEKQSDPSSTFTALFEEGEIPLRNRIEVYRNNVVGGLSETLIKSFPLMEKLVGTDFLKIMARNFVSQHPPEEGCINTYGRGFDAFVKNFRQAENLPYLPDIAAFEIAMTESYYAMNDNPLTAGELAAINSDALMELPLRPRAAVRLIKSDYPLDSIRDFCLNERKEDNETLDISTGGVKLMVHRPKLDVLIVKLAEDEFFMLQTLQNGGSLGHALEETLKKHSDFNMQAFLQKHMDLGTFTSFS